MTEREALPLLISAAEAVIARWDSLQWKEAEPTSVVVNRLRVALDNLNESRPEAWLCEFITACESVERQVVFQDPAGLRFNDAGEPSPFRVTPLYAGPSQ